MRRIEYQLAKKLATDIHLEDKFLEEIASDPNRDPYQVFLAKLALKFRRKKYIQVPFNINMQKSDD